LFLCRDVEERPHVGAHFGLAPLQVVAIRLEGERKLQHIVEHLVYDERNGLVQPMSRDQLLTYIDRHGRGSVISRDSNNTRISVAPFTHDGARWLRTEADAEREDNLYSLYAYTEPSPGATTWHAVSINFAKERTLASVFDFIVRSDSTGFAELVTREVLAKRIADAPGTYIVETPRIARALLIAPEVDGKKVVVTGRPSTNSPDEIFDLPRHSFNSHQLT
jgi:hypothetical protein